jgi:phosphatidylinositol glycan class U
VYLWNPFTILSCVGLSTSPIENLAVIVSLYGAVTRKQLLESVLCIYLK